MQGVRANLFAIPVRVQRNTVKGSTRDQWAKIIDARTGQVLHTGQLSYIKRIARQRYNVAVDLLFGVRVRS